MNDISLFWYMLGGLLACLLIYKDGNITRQIQSGMMLGFSVWCLFMMVVI